MADDFDKHAPGLDSPPAHFALVTPSDTVDLPTTTRGLSFGGAGTLKLTTKGGETLTLPSGALATAYIHPGRFTRVFATGTTATDIYAWW